MPPKIISENGGFNIFGGFKIGKNKTNKFPNTDRKYRRQKT